ncbi:MAG: hypothetical protein DRP62_05075 [Planctomycetota bacterium]|nr:MAG: hypothetical protein DRP62_05075 [Planctomycetota bacterium]
MLYQVKKNNASVFYQKTPLLAQKCVENRLFDSKTRELPIIRALLRNISKYAKIRWSENRKEQQCAACIR